MVRVEVVCVVVVQTQNFLSPATQGSGTRGSVARRSGTNEKFSKSRRVEVVRTQNFLSHAAPGSGTRRRGTNAKFSNTSRAW